MKVIGRRLEKPAKATLSAANLAAAETLMAFLRELAGGSRHFFPKGVYRYRNQDEADAAWVAAVARDMAELDHERQHGSGEVRARRDRR